MKHETRTIVVDAGEYSMKDLTIKADNLIWFKKNGERELESLPNTELKLTVAEALKLIEQLQIGLELVGKDFLVHTSGTIAVDRQDYDSIENYRNGITKN